jgi:predicted heme/steroid binding protein
MMAASTSSVPSGAGGGIDASGGLVQAQEAMLGELRKELQTQGGAAASMAPIDGRSAAAAAAAAAAEAPASPPSRMCPNTLKQLGNECFGAKEWLQAIDAYSKAIVMMAGRPMPEGHAGGQSQISELLCTLYCNRAACHLKTGAFAEATADCSSALEVHATNIKALYRRSQAREGLGDITGAMADLRSLITLDPNNVAGIRLTHEMRERHGLKAPGNEAPPRGQPGKLRLRDMSDEKLEDLKSRGLLSIYSDDPDYADMVFGAGSSARDADDVRPWEGLEEGVERPTGTVAAAGQEEGQAQVAAENFTRRQLAYFDGSTPKKRAYVALRRVVHNCTTGFGFYGKGGAYHMFAGHDASCSLALMSFDLKYVDEFDYDAILGEEGLKSLDNWCDTFTRKYPPVGRLITEMPEKREISREELAMHKGEGPVPEGWAAAPIYIALRGKVYDVSFGGTAMFGPGGPYSALAGKDATRALAKMSLDQDDIDSSNTSDLTDKEKATLALWSQRFRSFKRYPVVGNLAA